jgi:hypothetical protein
MAVLSAWMRQEAIALWLPKSYMLCAEHLGTVGLERESCSQPIE